MRFYPELFKKKRESCGFTLESLAATLRISRQAIFNWEKGDNLPFTKNVRHAADAFGCKVSDFTDLLDDPAFQINHTKKSKALMRRRKIDHKEKRESELWEKFKRMFSFSTDYMIESSGKLAEWIGDLRCDTHDGYYVLIINDLGDVSKREPVRKYFIEKSRVSSLEQVWFNPQKDHTMAVVHFVIGGPPNENMSYSLFPGTKEQKDDFRRVAKEVSQKYECYVFICPKSLMRKLEGIPEK